MAEEAPAELTKALRDLLTRLPAEQAGPDAGYLRSIAGHTTTSGENE
jgi:hypothetical protein